MALPQDGFGYPLQVAKSFQITSYEIQADDDFEQLTKPSGARLLSMFCSTEFEFSHEEDGTSHETDEYLGLPVSDSEIWVKGTDGQVITLVWEIVS